MIIACPACSTRYALPDSAIGSEGRTVRCANCRHSWFQEGQEANFSPVSDEEAPTAPIAAPPPAPLPQPIAPAPIPSLPQLSTPEPAAFSQDFTQTPSSFEHHPPFQQRRNTGRLWTTLAVGFALVSLGATSAVAVFGLPEWLHLPQASTTQPDLKLSFPSEMRERRPLPNGNDLFIIAGTITNIGKDRHAVPGLIITLRDSRNRAVYAREIAPAKSVLSPGESQTINTALVDAPKAAVVAEVQWKQH